MSKTRRGQVWLAGLEPRFGAAPGKTRPVLIVQSQVLVDAGYSSTLIVPLTTKLIDDAAPLRIRVPAGGRLRQDSDLLIAQLRAIDNRRIVRGPLATLGSSLMGLVDEAILEVLGSLPS